MEKTLKAVREMLEKQTFADWYNSRFADYIQDGTHLGITKEDIERDLSYMLHLE